MPLLRKPASYRFESSSGRLCHNSGISAVNFKYLPDYIRDMAEEGNSTFVIREPSYSPEETRLTLAAVSDLGST